MANEQTVAELVLKILADSSNLKKALEEADQYQKNFSKQTGDSTDKFNKDFNKAIDNVNNRSKQTSNGLNNIGSGLTTVSKRMTMLGAVLTGSVMGPMIAAGKTSQQVSYTLRNLTTATNRFSTEIGKSAIPVVEKFTKFVNNLATKFEDLPASTKENAVQIVAVSGSILTLVGSLGWLITTLKSIADLGKIPIIAKLFGAGAGVAAVGAGAYFGGKAIAETFEEKSATSKWGAGLRYLQDKLFPPKEKPMRFETGSGVSDWANKPVQVGSNVDLKKITVTAPKAGSSAKETTKQINEAIAGIKNGMGDVLLQFENVGEMMRTGTIRVVQSMASTFSSGLFDFLTGEFDSFSDYFAEFGRSILKMITDMIAQLMIFWAMKRLLGGTSFWTELFPGSKHEGGVIMHIGGLIKKAHSGLMPGEVPIVAQEYEGVLSRNGMATLGAENLNKLNAGSGMGGQTINLIQNVRAWSPSDFVSQKKMIAGMMIDELERNGLFRGAVKKWT